MTNISKEELERHREITTELGKVLTSVVNDFMNTYRNELTDGMVLEASGNFMVSCYLNSLLKNPNLTMRRTIYKAFKESERDISKTVKYVYKGMRWGKIKAGDKPDIPNVTRKPWM